ncbi:polysialic acid transport protein KpsM [Psychromonas sp. CNPT3]|uniref:ABC transporter permease n=1 Tax=Psychromonas sp. CNPT3 TaxID=314282 RepID=UPI00006E9D2E|nr:ABC transporter permease [Psychromonas sp. CNPT3]AGH81025.1 polysialic acid transport protein KpsM [Psychromonas sp. CNPT3]
MKKDRNSLQIMRDTVHALMMREIKTRFGSNRLGYFWAIAEPIAAVAVMGLIFSLLGRHSVANVPVVLFLFAAMLPFNLFQNLMNQLSSAVDANKALMAYRQVSAIDPVITRIIIELATYLVVYFIIFSFLAWFGFNVLPDDILKVLAASALLALLAIGFGLMLCVGMSYWQDCKKFTGIITRPLMYISGVLYCATMVPAKYWYLLDWNPIFHAMELSRDAFFSSYVTPIGSWGYLSLCSLVSFSLGITTFYLNRLRFITT